MYVGSGNRGFGPRKGQGLNSSWMADRVASSSLPLATLAPVLCIVAVALIAILLVTSIGSCVSSADNSSQSDGSQADQMEISYTPSIQAIDSVSDPGTNVQGVSLADSNASYVPQLSEEGATQVRDAVSAITANNKAVGFAFIDLQTGADTSTTLISAYMELLRSRAMCLSMDASRRLKRGKPAFRG